MRRTTLFLVIGLLVTSLASEVFLHPASAQSGGGYELAWYTIDGGGGMASTGGGYTLSGTIGQPDAGAALSGGGYTLTGGFWSGAEAALGSLNKLFLPLIRR